MRGSRHTLVALMFVCGGACGWAQEQETRSGVGDVITALRSTDHIDRATGCWIIQRQRWSSSEADGVAGELSKMIKTYTDIPLVLQAAESLAESHPEQAPLLLQAMSASISRETLNAGDWRRRRDACDIVRALGPFGSQASGAENHLERLIRRENEFPFASIRAAAALARIREKDRTLIDWLSVRLSGEQAVVAAEALGDAGPSARKAIPALTRLVEQGPPAERVVAAAAAWKLEGTLSPEVRETLFSAIDEPPIELVLEPFGITPPGISHSLYAALVLANRSKPNDAVHRRLLSLRANSHDAAQQRLLDESLRRINARAQSRDGVQHLGTNADSASDKESPQ